MKNNTWILILLPFSFLFIVNGCAFIKTVELEKPNEETISALMKQKQVVTLNQVGHRMYIIDNPLIENGILSGNLVYKPTPDHPENKKSFRHSKGKDATKYLHLKTKSEIKDAGPIQLPISELSGVETHEGDFLTSFVTTSGILLAAGAVGVVTFLAIACSCPHVATINPDGSEEMQGSLFPGSIFRSLKRNDYLILNNVKPTKDNMLEVKISNDLEEVQFIDQVQLFSVEHTQKYLGLKSNSQLIAFNEGESPCVAKSQIGKDVLEEIKSRDNFTHDFDDPPFNQTLNTVEMTFNISDLVEDALLIIRGKQTQLLEQTAEVFFQQFGSDFPNWVEKMNQVDKNKYNKNSINQGISLNVYVKKEDKWSYIGNYENVGSMAQRDLAIPIDLTSAKSEIEIKLETSYGFWSLDQVTLTSDWQDNLIMNTFNLISAVNQDKEDVLESAYRNDEKYIIQPEKGTYTTLKFNVPEWESGSFVLSGSGYYNHSRSYENDPNYKVLRKMNKNKYSTHQMAQMIQFYNDTQLASSN